MEKEKPLKILVLSLDPTATDSASPAGMRALEYARLAGGESNTEGKSGKYTVLVPDVSGGKIAAIRELRKEAESILSTEKYDLISVQDPYFVGLMATHLARDFDIALEVQVHGFERLTWLRRRIAHRVLARADGVRTVSKRLERMLIVDFGVKPDSISVVPIFADIESELEPEQKITQSEDGEFIFLTVSRLVPVKDIPLQLTAFAELLKNLENKTSTQKSQDFMPQNLLLWIAGDGQERGRLEAECRRLGISDRVRFFGKVDHRELGNLYRSANAFLLTSQSEGWGMAVVEAAAHTLPIIMTDVGCAGELIKNGESGIVIPVGDAKALVSVMERVLTDSALRMKLGAAAGKAVTGLPSKEQTLSLYAAAWKKAIELHHIL